jgi:hypothetical protein
VPDFERANRTASSGATLSPATFVALLIDCKDVRTPRPALAVSYEKGTELPDNGCIASLSIQSAPRRR